ncbi:MAG: succinate--CoA ligase subunit alpha [Candidatus Nezhaarchaeales archaeon]
MGIIVNRNTRVMIQGITGRQGQFHTKLMLEYGTKIVAGVTPGKGGTEVHGVPVYDTVAEAIHEHKVDASIIFVPAPFAASAALEALENGVKIIVIITEHIPVKDTIKVISYAKRAGATIIGPNTPGIITPGECKIGIMPHHVYKPGNVGIVSRSGTLSYEIAASLTRSGIGQSTCIGIGGDPVVGMNFVDVLRLFQEDPHTDAIVIIGEVGGNLEEVAAEYIIKENYSKPLVAFIAGCCAPPEKRMGHAGAIVMGRTGSAESKISALKKAGVEIAQKPSDIVELLKSLTRR